MTAYSLLYPYQNEMRTSILLDGMWKFQFDPKEEGKKMGWNQGLPDPIFMPVPASFSDFFTNPYDRDYCGDFWYETEFFLPGQSEGKEFFLRFGSITHRATIYCNGCKIGSHEGGFLPLVVSVREAARYGGSNRLVVKVNNELNEKSLPCGRVKLLADGRKLAQPYFDFFNYSGIHRSVWLMQIPTEAVQDYCVAYEVSGEDAMVHYEVITNGTHPVNVQLYDRKGNLTAESEGKRGTLYVKKAKLWQVRNAYLYRLVIQVTDGAEILDKYAENIGIRTVRVDGARILVNEKPVYLKGFGKHEDFEIIGRGFNWSVAKRDFECMKWTNANCFRTSHYPYAEEWYQFADEEGFLVIDEVPGVGLMRSTRNFYDAGKNRYTSFFESPTIGQLKAAHLSCVEEMILRDKNHPSVIAWSLFNEPETTSVYARDYFYDIFEAARSIDFQKRPCTGALEKNSSPQACRCYDLCDFISLNRYYGWYIKGGADLEDAHREFLEEMEQWKEASNGKPIVFTEFGADTLSTEHKLPRVMWSQEYQDDYLTMCFEVFDQYEFVAGELVWNFADFQTTEGIMRVNGNKKGIFTRIRQPKDAAYLLRRRWKILHKYLCEGQEKSRDL